MKQYVPEYDHDNDTPVLMSVESMDVYPSQRVVAVEDLRKRLHALMESFKSEDDYFYIDKIESVFSDILGDDETTKEK